MSDVDPFLVFIEGMPGLRRYALEMYRNVHKAATSAGKQFIVGRDVAHLRRLAVDPALTPNLRGLNQQMAIALERDPSGKLAVANSLRGWALENDIDRAWVTWWSALYCAYLDSLKAPSLVPMQSTGNAVEMAT